MNQRKLALICAALVSFFFLAPTVGRAFMVVFLGQAQAKKEMPLSDYWLEPLSSGMGGEAVIIYVGFLVFFLLFTFVLHKLLVALLVWVKK